jgi:hypothetical protein
MRRTALLFALVFASAALAQQRPLNTGAAEIRADLERARTVGSVLMIAAHPDDENTALLAYLAKGRHIRTGYLALTRGEGGQNLIGYWRHGALMEPSNSSAGRLTSVFPRPPTKPWPNGAVKRSWAISFG